MNKYVKKYQDCRNEGKSEYESFGVAATFISATGTMNDLQLMHDHFRKDLMTNVDKWLEEAEKVSQKIKLEESNYETA